VREITVVARGNNGAKDPRLRVQPIEGLRRRVVDRSVVLELDAEVQVLDSGLERAVAVFVVVDSGADVEIADGVASP
jgi:hypothetical protein